MTCGKSGFTSGLVTGAVLGIALGIFYAPGPGKKAREWLRRTMAECMEKCNCCQPPGKEGNP
ncbi:MAG: YtxH domain-containing protein [Chloroflexi bacterium]|nr:YtxH domain-containing protein [Chloroflexota bacterium]